MAESAHSQHSRENVEAAIAALRAAGLEFTAGAVLSGTVACTGNRGCRFAATDTKAHAVELANLLDARFKIEQPVNLHVTGCPHSCAQHYIGDIGLLGVKCGAKRATKSFSAAAPTRTGPRARVDSPHSVSAFASVDGAALRRLRGPPDDG